LLLSCGIYGTFTHIDPKILYPPPGNENGNLAPLDEEPP